MRLVKILGWLSGLSIIAYIIVIIVNEIAVYALANDDVDVVAIEDEIFKERQKEREARQWQKF